MPVPEVVVEEAADASEWDAAVERLPGGSFYHRHAWRSVNEESFGHGSTYLLARSEGRVVGLLPLTLVCSRLFGRILVSMPFVNFGGPCSEEDGVARTLVEKAVTMAREYAVDRLELRSTRPLSTDMHESLRKVSMILPLRRDPTAMWESFSNRHRHNLRRAIKSGLEVVAGGPELLPEFYEIMELAWRSLGTPFYSRRYFESILAAFPGAIKIFVCRHRGKAVATAWNGIWKDRLEGMWNGGNAEARRLFANYVLYWEMIQFGCVNGFSTFHLGRSTADSGSEDFKRRWTAEKHQLYFYHWRPDGARDSGLNVDNPRYRLLIAAWRQMPLAITRAVGPGIARAIP